MSSRRPTPQPEACYCGTPIPADGPSDLYCSPECQTRWLQKGHDYLPIPARPEWRMGASESDWRRSMAWPDVPALPPTDAELRQRIEDTDPSPVAEPPDFVQAYNRVDGLASKTPEQLQETVTAAADMGAQLPPAHLSNIDRIRNATRRNT